MRPVLLLVLSLALFLSCTTDSSDSPPDLSELERVTQNLVAPPFLPAHEQATEADPRIVEVRLVVEEKLVEVGPDGAKI
jgi:nitrite reductase (NO-forming)